MTHRRREAGRGQLRLWAFGYDMDNMKARCWYESTLPLYGVEGCEQDAQRRVEAECSAWLTGADYVASLLRGAVKDAWFGADARGDFSMVDASFWNRTEPDFYRHLKSLIETTRADHAFDVLMARQQWHQALKRAALAIFDEDLVGVGMIERQNPRRAAEAFRLLRNALEGPKLRQALGLPSPDVGNESKRSKKATKRAA